MSRTTRKPYSGSKAIDPACRCHGDCPWCAANRQHKRRKRDEAFKALEKTE